MEKTFLLPASREISEIGEFLNGTASDICGFTIVMTDGSIMNVFIKSNGNKNQVTLIKQVYNKLCRQIAEKSEFDAFTLKLPQV